MRILQGIAASPGVAIGEALILDTEGYRIPRRFVARDVVAGERQRLNDAIGAVAAEMASNAQTITRQLGEQYGAIFAAHAQMLRDPRLNSELETLIRDRQHSAEFAVKTVLRRYARVFEELGDSYLAERANDIVDLERSLLRQLLGHAREDLSHLRSPVLVLARNLTPNETARLDRQFVLGFATEIGGASGHTAIVAKGLEIPAVVGVGNFLGDLAIGDVLIIDGDHGQVILQPDDETIARYRSNVARRQSRDEQLTTLRDLPAETKDGVLVDLYANIEFPREVHACLERGANGIGLYRTEFLYLGNSVEPVEEEHFDAYATVVRAMEGRPVVIRTVDLGADKLGQLPLSEPEPNPFLGLRSIRLSLRNVSAFRIQLRAILRASALGKVRVMFPMISTLSELLRAKMVLADAMEDLDEAGLAYDHNVEVGMMVEVPSAVIMLDRFLPEVSFLSIGTNDLVQYVLAVDRSNNEVADAYQAGDPAVLRLLQMTLVSAASGNVPVSVCGQMCGEMSYIMLLLGLGLRVFSVPPSAIPGIKRVCRSVTIAQCEELAQRALTLDGAREIDAYLRDELRKVVPELVDV